MTLLIRLACVTVLAASAIGQSLKIVTYNIGSGASGLSLTGQNWKTEPIPFGRLVSHILQQDPDVVLLQEVHDRFLGGRPPVINQPEYWKRALGMNGHYLLDTTLSSFWGNPMGTAGNMILSKWPIVAVNDDLQPATRWFPVGFNSSSKYEDHKMSVVLEVNGRRVRVGNMHNSGTTRLLRYLTWLQSFPEPAILGGDANMESWHLTGTEPALRAAAAQFVTVPNQNVADRCGEIDWIMVQRGLLKVDSWEYGRVDGRCVTQFEDYLSDHPLVYATVSSEPVPVRNPGFERYFDAWSSWSPYPNYSAFVNLLRPRSGLLSALQTGNGGMIFRDLNGLVPGTRYEIAAWLWSSGNDSGKLSVHNTNGDNYMETPYRNSQGIWLRLSLVYTADHTGRVRVHLVRGENSIGIIFWDDLEITAVGSP